MRAPSSPRFRVPWAMLAVVAGVGGVMGVYWWWKRRPPAHPAALVRVSCAGRVGHTVCVWETPSGYVYNVNGGPVSHHEYPTPEQAMGAATLLVGSVVSGPQALPTSERAA